MSKGKEEKEPAIKSWGAIHCANCETVIAHFPPDCAAIDEDTDLELFCVHCAPEEAEKRVKKDG